MNVGERNLGETRPATNHGNVRRRWCPQAGIGGTEEEDTGDTARRREVADAGVVAEEAAALGETRDELGKRELVCGRAEWGEGSGGGAVGFAGDDEEFGVVVSVEPAAERDPARERPVFLRRAAAGVEGDEVRLGRGWGEPQQARMALQVLCRGLR